ncbi:hypothetical protein A2U01_0073344, partial [Trifolium medium]|nr:hypothetical protein [Trifolium medium]
SQLIVDDPTSKGSKRKTPEETARISILIPKKGVTPPPKVIRQLLPQTLLGKRGRRRQYWACSPPRWECSKSHSWE